MNIKYTKQYIYYLIWIITIPISNMIYKDLNAPCKCLYDLTTDIDRLMPFIKIFVIPYLFWYAFIPLSLTYICFRDKHIYFKTLISLNISLVMCYIIFYFFQTTVARPSIVTNDFISNLVKWVYKRDNPYNCFPSVHVATTYNVIMGVNNTEGNKKINFAINIIGILIMLSTQFMKQHVILDLFFAMFISETVFSLINRVKFK